ncbi:MAG TPA: cysteine--tRNA ligase [Thermoplasmata archaeon]|nr:cysteine--tRNA ligase [Thermoplasmata archaeon]
MPGEPPVIRIYNTLTRSKETFEPLHDRQVSMFVCGITPQDQTHLGHAKTYITFDMVARYLRARGYTVFYLQNVTDIEDRIIDKMRETGRDWKDIVRQYYGEYQEGMRALNCTSVDVYAYATDHIPQIVEQIRGLVDKGFAYATETGVYFDTTRFSDWGKLSGQKIEELRPGARVAVDETKRHPADFALWKAQKPGEPAWDSPWGKGRPGWHIEDTAITISRFGPQYDLHGGATELMFPHHEAEVAQAEAYTGVTPFVRYWMHGGMLMIKGEEMHKSLGNYWAVKDAVARWDPMVLRFFFLNAHYRSPIDFSPEAVEEAGRSYERLLEATRNLEAALRSPPDNGRGDAALEAATARVRSAFDRAMSDDFNTREAIAAIFEYARELNRGIQAGAGRRALEDAKAAFDGFAQVLGLFGGRGGGAGIDAKQLDAMIARREDARKRKDFATADGIRKQLADLGIVLEDTRDGVRWKRR